VPTTDGYLHESSDRPSPLYMSLHGTFDIKCHMTSNLWPCREELNRPENKGLKSTVDKLKSVKEAVDEGSKKYGKSSITDLHLKDDLLRPTSDPPSGFCCLHHSLPSKVEAHPHEAHSPHDNL